MPQVIELRLRFFEFERIFARGCRVFRIRFLARPRPFGQQARKNRILNTWHLISLTCTSATPSLRGGTIESSTCFVDSCHRPAADAEPDWRLEIELQGGARGRRFQARPATIATPTQHSDFPRRRKDLPARGASALIVTLLATCRRVDAPASISSRRA